MPWFSKVSPVQISSAVMNPAIALSITGALLSGARNSSVVLDKLPGAVFTSADAAYKDLTKKACEASFKSDVARLIMGSEEVDAKCLQDLAINMFLLNGMQGCDPKRYEKLGKLLDGLGKRYFEDFNKSYRAGEEIRSFVSSRNMDNSTPYKLHKDLLQELNSLIRTIPGVYQEVRIRLHEDYLKEGLIERFQKDHDITLDVESAGNISQHGNGSAVVNASIEALFASARTKCTSDSLNDTILTALAMLDFKRPMTRRVEPNGLR
ncbi:hypothetical protein SAMN05660489_05824 [Pseudomonas sp. LAMO17WK12:I10]|uniref:hypothetical protein n=1 Tax=unclassified Pseudomonas TaxID=196821 RepID=UPI000BD1D583|nr:MULTISPECIES: hypothetical protein [unclassified Pseudomonas]PXX53995.1 hypothetical protein H160_05818 [Pseudomonas sp. LAMO17WK12:I9]SNY51914.1 hypothetical protein SAMN05660489_05824 [Pseudomonas sp. LAMO17WK12:I10]